MGDKTKDRVPDEARHGVRGGGGRRTFQGKALNLIQEPVSVWIKREKLLGGGRGSGVQGRERRVMRLEVVATAMGATESLWGREVGTTAEAGPPGKARLKGLNRREACPQGHCAERNVYTTAPRKLPNGDGKSFRQPEADVTVPTNITEHHWGQLSPSLPPGNPQSYSPRWPRSRNLRFSDEAS